MRARKIDRAINWERERKSSERNKEKGRNGEINDGRGRYQVKQRKREKLGETIEERKTERRDNGREK